MTATHSVVIGDIGSSASKWALVGSDTVQYFRSTGYNAHSHGAAMLDDALKPLRQYGSQIDAVYYYGTGVRSAVERVRVEAGLRNVFAKAELFIESDLLGAARSTGKSAGIVGILGTGSNSCVYDGSVITDQIPTLGYPLGDAGSGWRIGLEVIKAFYGKVMPQILADQLRTDLPSSHAAFLEMLDREPAPNRYLASFARFAANNQEHPWMRALIISVFEPYLQYHVVPYGTDLAAHLIGGVAAGFEKILREVFANSGIEIGSITKDPMEGLVQYHNTKQ